MSDEEWWVIIDQSGDWTEVGDDKEGLWVMSDVIDWGKGVKVYRKGE